MAAAIHLVYGARTQVLPSSEASMKRALALMAKYRDVPMDLVHAQLVGVAEQEGIREVLTPDRRGFAAYRAKGRERFRLLP